MFNMQSSVSNGVDAKSNSLLLTRHKEEPVDDELSRMMMMSSPTRTMTSPRRSASHSVHPTSLLLQAAAGLEAMTSFRTTGSSSATPPSPCDPSPPPQRTSTTPRSETVHQPHHQQGHHRGPQPISPPPPSPQISAAELSMLTEASATMNGTFQCTLCNKQFGYKNGLIRHVRLTHVGEKPYQCTICNRRFGYKHILMEHQNLHFGNRPYACALCDKRFAARSNLIQHRMVHRRPYNCSMCGKRFDREDQLKKHLFAHPQAHVVSPGGTIAAAANSSTDLTAERRLGRRRGSNASAAADSDTPTGGFRVSSKKVRRGSESGPTAGGYGTEDDESSVGRPGDYEDDSAASHGSTSSPEPEDYGKPLLPSIGSYRLQVTPSGHRIDANGNQLLVGVDGVGIGLERTGSDHHQRYPNHSNISANGHHAFHQQHQAEQGLNHHQQVSGPGLFPGVVVKKELLDDFVIDQKYGCPPPPSMLSATELSATRRQASPRSSRPNGVEFDASRVVGPSSSLLASATSSSAQFPLTSFASWSSSRYASTTSASMTSPFSSSGSDQPHHVVASLTSTSSTPSAALPGIHEVFSRRNSSTSSHHRLPSFANFMPLSVTGASQTTSAVHPELDSGSGAGSQSASSSYKGATLPDLGLSLLNGLPVSSSSNHHGGSQPLQHQQLTSGVVNPTPRPTAQLPPIALQPQAISLMAEGSSTTVPTHHQPTKDPLHGVQHVGGSGFPSLDDVLSYYVSQGRLFRCQHCSILFFERGMYFLHASLHGLTSPWECSICHRVCSDKNEFTLHFVNQQHN